jgi:hypothetical protein
MPSGGAVPPREATRAAGERRGRPLLGVSRDWEVFPVCRVLLALLAFLVLLVLLVLLALPVPWGFLGCRDHRVYPAWLAHPDLQDRRVLLAPRAPWEPRALPEQPAAPDLRARQVPGDYRVRPVLRDRRETRVRRVRQGCRG